MNIQWDAEKYAQDFSFVPKHGADLIGMLDRETVHTVLDLGCGGGVLTKQLSEAGFSVLGMDASETQLQTPVDAVFSNAVLHWIPRGKHPQLLSCVYRALLPHGQFVFECGGYGNANAIHSALRQAFGKRHLDYRFAFYFPTVGEYTPLLEQAGFKVVSAELFDRPTPLKGENGLEDWIRMFLKEPFQSLSAAQTDEIIAEAVESLRPTLYCNGVWIADYVRLRCKAIKAP